MTDNTTIDSALATGEPLAETVDAATAAAGATMFGLPDEQGIDDAVRAEREFLTSLIWSPDTESAVHALVGDRAHRDRAAGQPVDRIPMAHPLFVHASHAALFELVVALVDEGAPVSPAVLQTRVTAVDRDKLSRLLIEVASPSGFGPLPGGRDVPYLARGVVDTYYRRGYIALIASMNQAVDHADVDSLAGHWATLTDHQQAADRRRLAVTDALAAL